MRNSPERTARAVSFVSAATEMVFALGEEACLGAVTSVCDYPVRARHSPRRIVCRSRIDASSMTSEEVTAAVEELKHHERERAVLENGKAGPPGNWLIDTKALEELEPSVVFVQSTCAVCDASSDDVLHALDETVLECNIVSVAPTSLEEMFRSISSVGLALGAHSKADALVSPLKSRVASLEAKLEARAVVRRPRVLSLEGLAPLCTGGGWLPDVERLAGCEDALDDVGGCSPRIHAPHGGIPRVLGILLALAFGDALLSNAVLEAAGGEPRPRAHRCDGRPFHGAVAAPSLATAEVNSAAAGVGVGVGVGGGRGYEPPTASSLRIHAAVVVATVRVVRHARGIVVVQVAQRGQVKRPLQECRRLVTSRGLATRLFVRLW